MSEEVYEAMKKIEEEKEAKAKEIGGMDLLGALFGMLFPFIGIIAGIYQLAKGRGSKGALYLGAAFAGFVCGFAVLMGS